MKVKATVSFSGAVSMIKGHTQNITDEQVLNDLLSCGYVIPAENTKSTKPTSKKSTKAVSGNEDKRAK